ncbi:hypothetical protein V8E54_010887 [Elaphomyces granulatus]
MDQSLHNSSRFSMNGHRKRALSTVYLPSQALKRTHRMESSQSATHPDNIEDEFEEDGEHLTIGTDDGPYPDSAGNLTDILATVEASGNKVPALRTPGPKDDSLENQFKELIQLLTIRELQAVRRYQQTQLQPYFTPQGNRSPRNPFPVLYLVEPNRAMTTSGRGRFWSRFGILYWMTTGTLIQSNLRSI